MGDRGNIRGITASGTEIISGFTINPQNIQLGKVNQAIAAAAGQDFALTQGPGSLLASRVTALVPPAQPAGGAATQFGVQLTTGMYLQCLSEEARNTLTAAANGRMGNIRTRQTFSIEEGNFGAGQPIPCMDHGFAQACSRAAGQGSIFIMRGVNPDSLGEGGVLTHPERYAPKPMTCHAKSSYFGFTKGLVPANPQFSRPDYVNTAGAKYQQALNDVQHTLGSDMKGTAEGSPLHLKVTINHEECFVHQGTFSKDGTTYRYQVAIPNGTDASPTEIRNRLQNPNYCKVCKDSNWGEVIDLRTLSPPLEALAHEPTLVIGLPANSEGSQQTTERYYVSDYDVYAIAHTTAAEAADTLITQNGVLQNTWENCGEFADNRDMAAINLVNALLLAPGIADPQVALQQYQANYDSNHRDRPIQHAAAAATTVKTTATGGLEGFAVPDFPLWVVEPGNVIKLENAGDLAAYMIHLSIKRGRSAEAILNSKVLDLCVNELISGRAA
jgi:hypothetical protein